LLLCAGATLFHHIHNAEHLGEYPGMPVWLTPAGVYVAWTAATVVGLAGYCLLRTGQRFAGVCLLVAYGCYALAGLVHYALAPLSAHTLTMNVSIWVESAAAAVLLAFLLRRKLE
jgi:hypothetical protein